MGFKTPQHTRVFKKRLLRLLEKEPQEDSKDTLWYEACIMIVQNFDILILHAGADMVAHREARNRGWCSKRVRCGSLANSKPL